MTRGRVHRAPIRRSARLAAIAPREGADQVEPAAPAGEPMVGPAEEPAEQPPAYDIIAAESAAEGPTSPAVSADIPRDSPGVGNPGIQPVESPGPAAEPPVDQE
ncbi:hypothetical protein FRC11_013461, partial [Ceratobasidium sp. 423]